MVTLVFWDVLAKAFHSLVEEGQQGEEGFLGDAERVMQFRRNQ
jgi:hypothetical protein